MDVVINMATEDKSPPPKSWDGPIELLTPDSSNKLRLNDSCVRKLQEIHCPLVVICVTGIYRTGKSYLLNRLAGRHNVAAESNGNPAVFNVSASSELETRGIWIWYLEPNADQNFGTLLVDTHGIGDPDTNDSHYDKLILCLSTLISSLLIYNCRGEVDASTMEKFLFINKLANSTTPVISFTEFILMVRDVQFDVEIAGQNVTEKKYMEHNLFTTSDKYPKAQNDLIGKFLHCFPSRTCVTLPMPASSKNLKALQGLKDQNLDEDFIKKYDEFYNNVVKGAPTKTFNYVSPVNGARFAELIKFAMDELEKKPQAFVDEIVKMFIQRENNNILNKFKDEFDESLLPNLDVLSWLRSNSTYLEKTFKVFLHDIIYEDDFASFKLFVEHVNRSIIRLFEKHYASVVDRDLRNFVYGVWPARQKWYLEFLKVCFGRLPVQGSLNTSVKCSKLLDVIKQEVALANKSDALISKVRQILKEIQQVADILQNIHDKCNRLVAELRAKQASEKKRLLKRLEMKHEEELSKPSKNLNADSYNQSEQQMTESQQVELINELTVDTLILVFLKMEIFDNWICRFHYALSRYLGG